MQILGYRLVSFSVGVDRVIRQEEGAGVRRKRRRQVDHLPVQFFAKLLQLLGVVVVYAPFDQIPRGEDNEDDRQPPRVDAGGNLTVRFFDDIKRFRFRPWTGPGEVTPAEPDRPLQIETDGRMLGQPACYRARGESLRTVLSVGGK